MMVAGAAAAARRCLFWPKLTCQSQAAALNYCLFLYRDPWSGKWPGAAAHTTIYQQTTHSRVKYFPRRNIFLPHPWPDPRYDDTSHNNPHRTLVLITLTNDIEIIFTLGNDAASALTLFRDAWFSRVRAGINSSSGGDHVIIIIVGDNRAIMISLDIHTHTNIAFPTTHSHSPPLCISAG